MTDEERAEYIQTRVDLYESSLLSTISYADSIIRDLIGHKLEGCEYGAPASYKVVEQRKELVRLLEGVREGYLIRSWPTEVSDGAD